LASTSTAKKRGADRPCFSLPPLRKQHLTRLKKSCWVCPGNSLLQTVTDYFSVGQQRRLLGQDERLERNRTSFARRSAAFRSEEMESSYDGTDGPSLCSEMGRRVLVGPSFKVRSYLAPWHAQRTPPFQDLDYHCRCCKASRRQGNASRFIF
jgi:hypothetical protein